jgi:transcriptional regulator with XRE-family HTH domain
MKDYGQYLKSLREAKGLTLRDVERAIQVSNPYLSQMESNKIKKPSPIVLHKLAGLYDADYEHLMKLVGYPVGNSELKSLAKYSPAKRFADVTEEEEFALLEYLAFIRKKRSRK